MKLQYQCGYKPDDDIRREYSTDSCYESGYETLAKTGGSATAAANYAAAGESAGEGVAGLAGGAAWRRRGDRESGGFAGQPAATAENLGVRLSAAR